MLHRLMLGGELMGFDMDKKYGSLREFQYDYTGHFFDRDTMRFFRSRILQEFYPASQTFLTSEKRCFDDYARVFHVRQIRRDSNGILDIATLGEFATKAQAVAYVRGLESK